jgi:hypothetical protein
MSVRYEDLVDQPAKEFQRVFDYLELKCELSTVALGTRVAQASSPVSSSGERRKWRLQMDEYSQLVSIVNSELEDEIRMLGYS